MFNVTTIIFINTNTCSCVYGPSSVVLQQLVRAPGQVVAVATANSADVASAAPVALVVLPWPIDGCDSGNWQL